MNIENYYAGKIGSNSIRNRKSLSILLQQRMSDQVDVMEWWKGQEEDNAMPHWTRTCKLVLLIQPSSAAAERVFSLLNTYFTSQQESSLEDYLQLSIMLQCNYRQVL